MVPRSLFQRGSSRGADKVEVLRVCEYGVFLFMKLEKMNAVLFCPIFLLSFGLRCWRQNLSKAPREVVRSRGLARGLLLGLTVTGLPLGVISHKTVIRSQTGLLRRFLRFFRIIFGQTYIQGDLATEGPEVLDGSSSDQVRSTSMVQGRLDEELLGSVCLGIAHARDCTQILLIIDGGLVLEQRVFFLEVILVRLLEVVRVEVKLAAIRIVPVFLIHVLARQFSSLDLGDQFLMSFLILQAAQLLHFSNRLTGSCGRRLRPSLLVHLATGGLGIKSQKQLVVCRWLRQRIQVISRAVIIELQVVITVVELPVLPRLIRFVVLDCTLGVAALPPKLHELGGAAFLSTHVGFFDIEWDFLLEYALGTDVLGGVSLDAFDISDG
jgi:hypothetical protein